MRLLQLSKFNDSAKYIRQTITLFIYIEKQSVATVNASNKSISILGYLYVVSFSRNIVKTYMDILVW